VDDREKVKFTEVAPPLPDRKITENKLSGLAAYAVLYALYFILSVYWAAGGTMTTLNIGD